MFSNDVEPVPSDWLPEEGTTQSAKDREANADKRKKERAELEESKTAKTFW